MTLTNTQCDRGWRLDREPLAPQWFGECECCAATAWPWLAGGPLPPPRPGGGPCALLCPGGPPAGELPPCLAGGEDDFGGGVDFGFGDFGTPGGAAGGCGSAAGAA